MSLPKKARKFNFYEVWMAIKKIIFETKKKKYFFDKLNLCNQILPTKKNFNSTLLLYQLQIDLHKMIFNVNN